MDKERIKERMEEAIREVIYRIPITSTIAHKIRLKEAPIRTLAIIYQNGQFVLYYDPYYVSKKTFEELCFLVAHEFFHILLEHLINNNVKYKFYYNVAADAIINTYILDWYFDSIPDDVITLSDLVNKYGVTYKDWYAEELVEYIVNNEPLRKALDNTKRDIEQFLLGKKDYDDITHHFSEKLPALISDVFKELFSEEIPQETKERIKETLRRIRDRGKLPGYFEKLLDIYFKESKIKWKQLLRNEVFRVYKELSRFYNIRRPSKKVYIIQNKIGKKIFLPSTRRKEKINIVVCIDVSGSIRDEEYGEFINEVYNIMRKVNADGYIITFDAEVKSVLKLKEIDKLKLRKGYGGTIVKKAIEKARELANPNQTILIIFTDGYTEELTYDDIKDFAKVIIVYTDTCKNYEKIKNIVKLIKLE